MRNIIIPLILILAAAFSAQAQDVSTHRFFIKLKPGTAYTFQGVQGTVQAAALETLAAQTGVSTMRSIAPPTEGLQKQSASDIERIFLVTLEEGSDLDAALAAFGADPNVEYAEAERIYRLDVTPNDSAWAEQWGTKRIGMESAWEVTEGSSSVIVGVIDTGIDYLHEDLKSQLWVNSAEDINSNGSLEPWPAAELRDGLWGDLDSIDNDGNGYVDDVIGYDFVNQLSVANAGGGDYRDPDPDPLDEHGHGSSVSGIIAAAKDNTKGIAGVAPGVPVMVLRAFDARGIGTEGDVAQAIAYAVANEVDILNMSFGDVIYSRILRDVIRYAYGRGVVMICSAGNDANTELHYPSSYDETISVSAISEGDYLASFSTYGATIDISAPGQDIVTANKNNGYTSFNGTSASAPFVTGVAALIKSLHPEFSPEEVRGVLISSSEDLGAKGWDMRFGAGLLDAVKAVGLENPTEVRILSPKTDFATKEGSFPIIGTAVSPIMSGYRLDYGIGNNPSTWKPLVPFLRQQVIADTLYILNTDEFEDTTYTLRLAAVSERGTTLEDRVVIHIDRTPPEIYGIGFIPSMDANAYGVALGFIGDEPTLGKVWYRRKNSSDPWKWVSMESASENNLFVASSHYRFLGAPYIYPGHVYEFYMTAENEVGSVTTLNDQGASFEVTIPQPVSQIGFKKKPYSWTNSRLSGVLSDFNGNGLPELLLNETIEGNLFRAVEFNGTGLTNISGTELDGKLPRAAGDVNGDGRDDLMASVVRTGFLFDSQSPGTVPDKLVWADTTSPAFWPIAIHDVNNDGNKEVLAVIDDTTVGVYSFDASFNHTLIGTMVNPSPGSRFGPNAYNSPTAAFGDFNNNGKTDILLGDNDADFFIYESQGGGTFTLLKGIANDYESGGEFVQTGDFDGDGRDEFAVGFRTTEEDVIPFWFFGIYQLDGQNKLQELWGQAFYGIETGSQSGLFTRISNNCAAGNIDDDAEDELVISVYPELYVIDFNTSKRAFEPIWYHPLANSNATVIADIDDNGISEIVFAAVDSVLFFERDLPYNGPPPPRSISVIYQGPTQAEVSWTADIPAPLYRLYRGDGPGTLELSGTFDNTSVSDAALQIGGQYIYAVSSYDTTKTPAESPKIYSRMLHPHERPVVQSGQYLQLGQIMLLVSQDMGNAIPSVDRFILGTSQGPAYPSSVVLADSRSIILTFDKIDDGDSYITINGLRDGEGIPFTDSHTVVVEVENIVDNELYIERVEYLGGRDFCVYFNIPVDKTTAENAANYIIQPVGRAVTATRDPDNHRKVCFSVADGIPIGAVGKEYVLKVSNLVSTTGVPIVTGAGSTAGIILNRQTLEDVFVYPNPWSPQQGQDFITFANLTQEATIRVYTLTGQFINEIEEKDGNGGVEWDLRDEHGVKLPSGVYIYYVTGKNSSGAEVDAVTAKFAIVR